MRGTLQFILPATQPSLQAKQTTDLLRVGTTAVAVIVARERRLIELVLDLLRNVGG
ncbi:hypothetical protein [Massilia yuzhufengensis]|uniref:hypothetical protein n=1 Tax=Massilia yuzhufengensis TaxID=1164594 RepID=UPI0015A5E8AE|nr:hypothetical protein [Massilia yuzhufengensis]